MEDTIAEWGLPPDPNYWTAAQWEQAWVVGLNQFRISLLEVYNLYPAEMGNSFVEMGLPPDPYTWTELQWAKALTEPQEVVVPSVPLNPDNGPAPVEFRDSISQLYKQDPSLISAIFPEWLGLPPDPTIWDDWQWNTAWDFSNSGYVGYDDPDNQGSGGYYDDPNSANSGEPRILSLRWGIR
jgi:hypothetical protein